VQSLSVRGRGRLFGYGEDETVANEGNAYREAWRRARTLEDLGELTAAWAEGTVKWMPTDASEPYEETEPLREVLAAINRNGFVTTFSQPGEAIDEEGRGQRAAVEGWAREGIARCLGSLALWTDLLVFAFEPGNYSAGYQVPITTAVFRPFTWVGGYDGHELLEQYAEDCSREAIEEIMQAWTMVIIDPCWGRKSHLWEHVSAALEGRSPETRFSVEPYHTGLDHDFGV